MELVNIYIYALSSFFHLFSGLLVRSALWKSRLDVGSAGLFFFLQVFDVRSRTQTMEFGLVKFLMLFSVVL
jgi:hypothetical protein